MIGLFLGAGASYELGMPLVWDLTREIKQQLTPEKIRMFNQSWRSKGTAYADEVVEDFIRVLELPNQHYESILGYLETQFLRNGPHRNDYHGLYSWLVEVVYVFLQERHTRNLDYIQKNSRFYDGFQTLASQQQPLWVFSLNHDLIVECLAAKYSIPLNAGFGPAIVNLPRRNTGGKKIGAIKCEIFTGDQLEKSAMPFFNRPGPGINLLKIHGSLDVFTCNDGKDLLRILPDTPSISSWIECLRTANEELFYLDENSPSEKLKVTNEISYADDTGEMQFLRRTLLSGAYKFDRRMTQVLPVKLLDHLRSNLNFVSTLIVAGYSFGDQHINQILKDWLGVSGKRQLLIVDPFMKSVPSQFLHLSLQIGIKTMSFTDYLDEYAGIQRSRREILEKRLGAWMRKNQFDPEKKNEYVTFMQGMLDEKSKAFVNDISSLPIKNGDIDIRALGVTSDQLVKDILAKNDLNIDDLLERFLKDRSE